jgi:molybdopterin-guanine dinucleotide biosynthesis protein MobB
MECKTMRVKVPVVAVVGSKDSGKTIVVENLVHELTKKGYRVATAKHVNIKGFSIDTKGKDTWRHLTAGANPVISVSDAETAIMIKNGEKKFSPNQILRFAPEIDVILLEGFSWLVLGDEYVGKIFCVKNMEEYKAYRQKVKGETIAFCSIQPMESPILRIKEDASVLNRQGLEFVDKEIKVLKILGVLPGLNCEKCGYKSCEELAAVIHRGKAKTSDCTPLSLKSELKTKITINDAEIPIQPFVSRIMRNAVLSMISSLKGVSIKGDEKLHIKISS